MHQADEFIERRLLPESPSPTPLPRAFCLAATAQELEFIIHPDGRVEERVRGVKGIECAALTEEINKALGEVYETKPTNEMYEQKVEVEVEAEATVSEGWGTTSWGQSDGGSGSEW